jgi:hypothetical protein
MIAPPLAASALEWFTAAGTVGAVVVALYLQLALPRWLRPKLEIPRGAAPEPVRDRDGIWWDIPIVNCGRGTSAIAAQAMLTNVVAPSEQPPIALRSLRWTHVDDEARVEVPAGIVRWVQLGKKRPSVAPELELGLHPPMGETPRKALTVAGEYRFSVALVARNATARHYAFTVWLMPDGALDVGEIVPEPRVRRLRRGLHVGPGMRSAREPQP